MKNFHFNLLQQLNKKKAEKGFTLIELLVVIIIIGILSAIALPAFLNQANKARQSEAKQALGAINRGQQAYFLEKITFSNTIDRLGLGVATDTPNYEYRAGKAGTIGEIVSPTGDFDNTASVYALAKTQDAVRDYVNLAYLVPATATAEATTRAILCEEESTTENSSTAALETSTLVQATPAETICGTNSAPVQ